jgi:O-methyltransferase
MNTPPAKDLYLELLKKTLLYEIWTDNENDLENRHQGLDWPMFAHTMIGRLRMNNLHQCMQIVMDENIEGDFIETGVWRGGACIFMRGFLKAYGVTNRRVWVADSFEGLPAPDLVNYPADKGLMLHSVDVLRVSLEQVQNNFRKYDLLDEQVCFLKGWFKDTLPTAPIEKIAVARLDGDMYSSTMESLMSLYPKISNAGFIIIDDYFAVPQCRKAVTDFRDQLGIDDPIEKIDWTGVFWRKSNKYSR